jgi:hypothetical protein
MRVLLGPINTAGSALRLAVALRREGIGAEAAAVDDSNGRPLLWPADRRLPRGWHNAGWERHLRSFSHFLLWSGLSLRRQRHWWDDAGHILPGRAAIVATGSEFRLPLVHKTLERWSPYGDDAFSQKLIAYADRWHARLERVPLPVFVHTAGMLDYGPATWMPIIGYPLTNRPLLVRKTPVVLYSPTNALLKGAQYVEATDWTGFDLVYPSRNGLVTPNVVDEALIDCDLLIGGLVLGDYGLTEIEGMAAGRLVIANVGERVRAKMPEEPPIVHATPDTLASIIADILANRDRYREIAARGPEFVERWHDGRHSVAQLRPFLGLSQVAA